MTRSGSAVRVTGEVPTGARPTCSRRRHRLVLTAPVPAPQRLVWVEQARGAPRCRAPARLEGGGRQVIAGLPDGTRRYVGLALEGTSAWAYWDLRRHAHPPRSMTRLGRAARRRPWTADAGRRRHPRAPHPQGLHRRDGGRGDGGASSRPRGPRPEPPPAHEPWRFTVLGPEGPSDRLAEATGDPKLTALAHGGRRDPGRRPGPRHRAGGLRPVRVRDLRGSSWGARARGLASYWRTPRALPRSGRRRRCSASPRDAPSGRHRAPRSVVRAVAHAAAPGR